MVMAMLQRAGTCAEACWNAREDVCRCACNGANHGCLLVNGAPAPGRTKRTADTRWRLHAVTPHWDYMKTHHYLGDSWAFQVVPKGCKWPEAQGADDSALFLWVRVEVTEEQAAAQFARAMQMDDLAHRHYHRTDCDGVTQWRGAKIQRPCEDPAAHVPKPALEALYATLRCRWCEKGDCSWHYNGGLCSCPGPHTETNRQWAT